jgi:hypothetical protein
MELRYPWDTDPAPIETPSALDAPPPKRRGRRPAAQTSAAAAEPPVWRYHHLTVSGPAESVASFATAARGAGVIPWQLDVARIEEDVFNLAAAEPAERRHLTIAGCRILARQFRERVEVHHARAVAQVGQSRACPLDLHALLPVPPNVLALGPIDPTALAWLAAHWGTTDRLRQVTERQGATIPQPAGHSTMGYGFFTAGETPKAAFTAIGSRWSSLRFALQLRSAD